MPVSSSGIYGKLLLLLVLLSTTAKLNKTLFAGIPVYSIRVELRALLAADCTHACAKWDLAKSRFYFARRTRAKNYLLTKLTSQKPKWWPSVFQMQNYSTAKAECVGEIFWENCAMWNCHFFELRQNPIRRSFFIILPVSSSVCYEKIFIKKNASPG